MIIYREYLLTYAVDTHLDPPQPHPPSPSPLQRNQIWIPCRNSFTRELRIRIVEILLKKLLTYFLICCLNHMFYIVYMVAFLYITSFDSLAYCFGSTHGPTSPHQPPAIPPFSSPTPPKIFFRFGFFVKIH